MSRYFAAISFAALIAATPALAQSSGETRWDGPYVGVNVGYGGTTLHYPLTATLTNSADPTEHITVKGEGEQTASGVIGGGQVGYNFQTGGIVLGAEADIAASGIKGRTALEGAASGVLSASASGNVTSKLEYLGTVRLRAGVPLAEGRFMPYVTGGFAYGRTKTTAEGEISLGGSPIAGGIEFKNNRTGWTLGAGAEYAITDHISFRAEYLYADLGKHALIDERYSVSGDPLDVLLEMKTTANILRVGMNYRF